MSDNTGRVLTVRLTITDAKEADWIWDAVKTPKHGVQVSAISNGDMFSERDVLAEAACFYIREKGETTEEAIDASCEPFSDPDDAAREAPQNVGRGASWDIVDRHGTVVRSSA